MTVSVPDSYAAWRHCIEVECGLRLDADYIDARLIALENPGDFHTRKFIALWGEAHRQQVIGWFRQARLELAARHWS